MGGGKLSTGLLKTANNIDYRGEGFAGSLVKAIMYAMVFAIIFALLVYLGLSFRWIPLSVMKPVFLYCNYFAVLLGAVSASLGAQGRGWLIGLTFGAIYFLLALLIAPVWNVYGIAIPIFLARLGIVIALGILGGMIGINL